MNKLEIDRCTVSDVSEEIARLFLFLAVKVTVSMDLSIEEGRR